MRSAAVAVLGLLACEHIGDVELATPVMPASSVESPRINIDAIGPKVVRHAGVAPVRPALADPQYTLPREQVTAFEDPPPPEPIVLTEAQRWFLSLGAGERKTVREICREGRRDPCFGMLPRPRGAAPTRMEQLMAQLSGDRHATGHTVHEYCRQRDPSIVCDTPLVVAFDGHVEFEPSTASFAFGAVPTRNDWPTAATPWIALDRDGDGAITSGAELFGDATVLPNGAHATNGFEALAALDANHDGVIDRRDPMFDKLVLWSDRDGDRKSAGELTRLADVIEEIPLAHSVVPRCDRGNCEGERASMTWRDADGRTRIGAVIDVYLSRR